MGHCEFRNKFEQQVGYLLFMPTLRSVNLPVLTEYDGPKWVPVAMVGASSVDLQNYEMVSLLGFCGNGEMKMHACSNYFVWWWVISDVL